jgi:hypothetical protein
VAATTKAASVTNEDTIWLASVARQAVYANPKARPMSTARMSNRRTQPAES